MKALDATWLTADSAGAGPGGEVTAGPQPVRVVTEVDGPRPGAVER